MAYQDKNSYRLKKLIRNPHENIGKILPFIWSRLILYRRDICESLGIEKYSKPYQGHKTLLKHINKKNGFFIHCGGSDGFSSDPSYYLEMKMGWRGIITEPLPISKLCKRNRKWSTVIQCACVPFTFVGNYVSFIDCFSMSFIKGSGKNREEWIKEAESVSHEKAREISVPARSIQSILDEYSVHTIDLFVIDVEGAELLVLQGLDFSKNAPEYLLIESRDIKEMRDYIEPLGYAFIENIVDRNEDVGKDYLFKKR